MVNPLKTDRKNQNGHIVHCFLLLYICLSFWTKKEPIEMVTNCRGKDRDGKNMGPEYGASRKMDSKQYRPKPDRDEGGKYKSSVLQGQALVSDRAILHCEFRSNRVTCLLPYSVQRHPSGGDGTRVSEGDDMLFPLNQGRQRGHASHRQNIRT